MYATTFTSLAVTPGAVAPPLFLPSGHGFTQNGPPPTMLNDVRPFSVQDFCANAAAEPRPSPFGCGPVPGPVTFGAVRCRRRGREAQTRKVITTTTDTAAIREPRGQTIVYVPSVPPGNRIVLNFV